MKLLLLILLASTISYAHRAEETCEIKCDLTYKDTTTPYLREDGACFCIDERDIIKDDIYEELDDVDIETSSIQINEDYVPDIESYKSESIRLDNSEQNEQE